MTETKQVDAGALNVGYLDGGPGDGTAVILLHGWPYDVHSFTEVAPTLSARGYRVIAPYLRGFGPTRFRSPDAFRNGQQAALARDVVDLMDALNIKRAILGGFDWGGRAAVSVAALWPQRCKALVSVSGYSIINLVANQQPLPPRDELGWWYQYYFATQRGLAGYELYHHDFAKLIWHLASPRWDFDDATFDLSAPAFDNPDHARVVIHNYRWRLGLAGGEAQYSDLERQLATTPAIVVPSTTIGSDFDGPASDGKAWAKHFAGKHKHRTLHGIGHNVPQEDPRSFADAIVDADTL